MKRLFYLSVLFGAILMVKPSMAQISIQINLGFQPKWGPSGYDYVEYYYLPEYEMYYDVLRAQYIYWDYDRWASSAFVPTRYSNIDLYSTYKVVLNGREPWGNHHDNYYAYRKYASYVNQMNLRDYLTIVITL